MLWIKDSKRITYVNKLLRSRKSAWIRMWAISIHSIHKPISDRVSRLLLKILCVWYRNVEFLTCLMPTLRCTFTDLKHAHIQLTSFYHSPDRASYLDILLARSENNSTRRRSSGLGRRLWIGSVITLYTCIMHSITAVKHITKTHDCGDIIEYMWWHYWVLSKFIRYVNLGVNFRCQR